MITVKFLATEIKSSTFTELVNALLQTTDGSLTKIQNSIQKILKTEIRKDINNLEEDDAKYIWDTILNCYPEAEIEGILYDPLKRWYKINIFGKKGKELYKTQFIKTTSEKKAIKKTTLKYERYGNFQYKVTDRLTLEETKKCQLKDDIAVFEADGCTRQEAKKFLKNGAFVIPAEEWNRWAKANEWYDEDELITLERIKKGQQDIKIVKIDHIKYVIVYML